MLWSVQDSAVFPDSMHAVIADSYSALISPSQACTARAAMDLNMT